MALTILAAVVPLVGCTKSSPTFWASNYKSMATAPANDGTIDVVQLSWDDLINNRGVEGAEMLGRTYFREQPLPPQATDPTKSPLVRQGRNVGANLIRWATRPAGKAVRSEMIKDVAPSSQPSPGNIGTGARASQTTMSPTEVKVDVADYLAYFYYLPGPDDDMTVDPMQDDAEMSDQPADQ